MAERSYKVRLEAEYQAFVQAMGQAATAVDKVGDAADKASKRVDTATKAQADAAGRLRTAEQHLADARAKHPAQSAQVVAAEERVTKARRDLDKATEETTAAEAALRAEMGRTDAAAKAQETSLGRLTKSADANREAWDRAGTALTAFGAITTVALGATVKAAMDWESAWTGVLKTADGTPAELAALEGSLRGLAKTLPATHQEIAAVAEAAGQLGVGVNSVATFTKTMIDLGETTNLSADEAATAIAQMANVMDPSLLSSSDGVSRFGATLVALGNDGASTEKQILEMAQRISGSGKLVGASSAEVLALSNALASMGITAELGGGVVSRILQDIYSAVKDGGPRLAQFAALAGQSAEDFATAFADDPVRALDAVAQGLNGVDQSGGNVVATLRDLGFLSTEEQRVLLQLKGAGDLLTESLDLGNRAWAENSALIEEANKRYDTAEAKVQIAKNSINDAAITIGDALLPALASAAEAVADLANWFGSLPEPVQQTIGGLGGLVGVMSLAAGGFLLLFPRVIETVTAFRDLRDIAPGAAGGLGKVGKAAGLAAVAITTMMAASALPKWGVETADGASGAAKSLLDVASGAKTADQAFSGMFSKGGFKDWITGNDIDNVREAYKVLKDPSVSQNIDNTISSVLTLGQATSTNRLQSEEFFNAVDQGAASLAQSGAIEEAKAGLEALGLSVEKDMDLLPLYAEALASADVQQQIAGKSADGLAGSFGDMTPATKAAQEALAEWTEMVGDADASFSDIGGAYQGVIDKNKEIAQSTADATKDSKDSWEDFYDGASVSMDDWIAKLEEQARAQANWQDNILTITSEIRQQMPADMVATADAIIDELIALGEAGAPALQTFREASAEERIRLVEAWSGAGFEIAEEVAGDLSSARAVLPVDADTAPATASLASLLTLADTASGTMTMFGESGPVEQTLDSVRVSIDEATGTVSILGEDGQAVTTLRDYVYSVDAATGAVTIQGRDDSGRSTVLTLRDWINAQGASVKVDASTINAAAAVERFISSYNGRSINIGVSAATIVGNPSMGFVPGGYTGGRTDAIAGYAGGGRIPGASPSSPREDNVLAVDDRGVPRARYRSGEWIQSQPAVDYYGDGIMAALNARQIPKDLFSMLPGLASGGRVGAWERRVASDRQRVLTRRDALKKAKKGEDDKKIKAAEKALDEAEERYDESKAALSRTRELTRDTKVDVRRGSIRDQATSGLSGGYAVVDDLLDQSRNTDLSAGARKNLATTARYSESALKKLYGQAEKLEKRLEAARDRVQELSQIKAGVASVLSGGFSLAESMKREAPDPIQRTNQYGEVWYDQPATKPVTGKSMLADARGYAGKVKAFALKLAMLRKKGFSGVILQEVAQMGVDGGTQAAEALLQLSSADTKLMNTAYQSIEAWSGQAGQYVTEGFHKGGVAAAEGLVAGLESQQKAIEAQIEKVAKGMEDALKRALGIKSPSRVMRRLMDPVGDGTVLGLDDQQSKVEAAAERYAKYLTPEVPTGAGAVPAYALATRNPAGPAQNLQVSLAGARVVVEVDGQQMRGYVKGVAGQVVKVHADKQDRSSVYERGL